MDGVKGVIFDMDGVLCDSEPFILEAGADWVVADLAEALLKIHMD